MSEISIPEPVTLPCGCFVNFEIEIGIRVAKISPCHLGCPLAAEVFEMALEMDKPVEFRRFSS